MLEKVAKLVVNNKWLVLVVLLGLILRVVKLAGKPPSLNWDEVSHGYNTYSILLTGKDEWGKFLPMTNFRAYGDYPLPLNLYLTIPFIYLLGLTEFAIRLPHAILGALTILATYFLTLGITKNEKIGYLSALLVAVTPWYLFTSRFVVQSNLSIFFLTASAAAFFNREKHKYLLSASFFSLGLTLFSYHTTRIFSPLFLIGLFIVYKKEISKLFNLDKRVKIISWGIILLFFLPLPFILANPEARARSKEVFLIDEGAVNKIVEKRLNSEMSQFASKLLYNRPTYFAYHFIKNYFGYFSPQFLFLEGGTQYQFSLPKKGLLYLINLPFFYFGLFILLKKAFSNDKDYQFLLGWLLASPIPASITRESFAVLRSTTMLPLPEFLSALGLFTCASWLIKTVKKDNRSTLITLTSVLYLSLLFVSGEVYLNNYFNYYPKQYSQAWQYGYKQVVDYVKRVYDSYGKIVITKKYGEPHEFFLFYWPWDPEEYRNDPSLVRFNQSNWFWVDKFDKFYFVNDWQINEEGTQSYVFNLESGSAVNCLTDNCLLISSPGNVPLGWSKLETISFLDGQPAFEIYVNN